MAKRKTTQQPKEEEKVEETKIEDVQSKEQIAQDLPVEGVYKRVILPGGAYRLTAGVIAGLDATDKNWMIEVHINGKKCYIISSELYEKSM